MSDTLYSPNNWPRVQHSTYYGLHQCLRKRSRQDPCCLQIYFLELTWNQKAEEVASAKGNPFAAPSAPGAGLSGSPWGMPPEWDGLPPSGLRTHVKAATGRCGVTGWLKDTAVMAQSTCELLGQSPHGFLNHNESTFLVIRYTGSVCLLVH